MVACLIVYLFFVLTAFIVMGVAMVEDGAIDPPFKTMRMVS